MTKKELIEKMSHLKDDDEVFVYFDGGAKKIHKVFNSKWDGKDCVVIEGESQAVVNFHIRKKIKEIRKKKRVTLRELAEKTGKKISYLSDVENGRKNIPDKQVLLSIEFALGLKNKELTMFK